MYITAFKESMEHTFFISLSYLGFFQKQQNFIRRDLSCSHNTSRFNIFRTALLVHVPKCICDCFFLLSLREEMVGIIRKQVVCSDRSGFIFRLDGISIIRGGLINFSYLVFIFTRISWWTSTIPNAWSGMCCILLYN